MRRRRTPRLTAQHAAVIKLLAQSTDLMQHEIAAKLGINQGRVSEVVTGKRFAHVPPAAELAIN